MCDGQRPSFYLPLLCRAIVLHSSPLIANLENLVKECFVLNQVVTASDTSRFVSNLFQGCLCAPAGQLFPFGE